MGSFINYKFVNSRSFSKINFEGASLLGWELKSEIIAQKQMLSEDFDLILYENEEEVTDDTTVYRNSSIVVKRIPLWMTKTKPVIRESIKQRKQKAPPINYICFRCGQKGHFIQYCPTNQDKNFEALKIRKPTGIPKAFLVESKEAKEGNFIDERGSYVRILPQEEEWKKIKGVLKSNIPDHLICYKCNEIYSDPYILDCHHSFCNKCILSHCSICNKKIEKKEKNRNLEEELEKYFNK